MIVAIAFLVTLVGIFWVMMTALIHFVGLLLRAIWKIFT